MEGRKSSLGKTLTTILQRGLSSSAVKAMWLQLTILSHLRSLLKRERVPRPTPVPQIQTSCHVSQKPSFTALVISYLSAFLGTGTYLLSNNITNFFLYLRNFLKI